MHKRLFPKKNSFTYGVYYLALPLPAAPIPGWLTSFHAKDLGNRDGSDPIKWARCILANYDLDHKTHRIVLITMPRILGYVFNPVSFYLCLDTENGLRAVLCEVHNTFGEQHTYLCANPDHAIISDTQWLESQKVFHVSPFLKRQGSYKFRFDLKSEKLGIWIDFYDEYQQKQLLTSLAGTLAPLTSKTLRQAFWGHPMVAFKSIFLIHFQALKLMAKGIRHIKKPEQVSPNISPSRNLSKM